jgi:hypothetical protein
VSVVFNCCLAMYALHRSSCAASGGDWQDSSDSVGASSVYRLLAFNCYFSGSTSSPWSRSSIQGNLLLMMSTTLNMYAFVVQIGSKRNLPGVYSSQQSPSQHLGYGDLKTCQTAATRPTSCFLERILLQTRRMSSLVAAKSNAMSSPRLMPYIVRIDNNSDRGYQRSPIHTAAGHTRLEP